MENDLSATFMMVKPMVLALSIGAPVNKKKENGNQIFRSAPLIKTEIWQKHMKMVKNMSVNTLNFRKKAKESYSFQLDLLLMKAVGLVIKNQAKERNLLDILMIIENLLIFGNLLNIHQIGLNMKVDFKQE